MSLMPVVGAILFARSLQNLTTLDAGFTQNGMLELDLDLDLTALRFTRRFWWERSDAAVWSPESGTACAKSLFPAR